MSKRTRADAGSAAYDERQSNHAREAERFAQIIDALIGPNGRARDLLALLRLRLHVPAVRVVDDDELDTFNADVCRLYTEGGFWREADAVGRLWSAKGKYFVVRSRDRGREHGEESDTAPPPARAPFRARAQHMCFMTTEALDRANELEIEVVDVLDLEELSVKKFVRSVDGKAPVMIDTQLEAGRAASRKSPTKRDAEHLEFTFKMAVAVGADSVLAWGPKARARARSLLSHSRDAM